MGELKFKVIDPNSEDFNKSVEGEIKDDNTNLEDIADDGKKNNEGDYNGSGEGEGLKNPVETEEEEVVVEDDVDESKILKFFKEKYQKDYEKIDDVFIVPEKEELPEDIKRLIEYGVDNYVRINKDWDKEDDTAVLVEYYKQTKPHLDRDDVNTILEDSYSFDEDLDDEKDIKRKKVLLKEELFKARTHLNGLKESLKVELESKTTDIPENYKKAFEFYQEYEQSSKSQGDKAEAKARVFSEKTEQLFSKEFKGFEFDLGEDNKQFYVPKNVDETKLSQSDISKVIAKHLDKDGNLKDAHQYHKALAMFRDPDGFAKFFYEQGKASATESVIKDVKNISMSVKDIKDTNINNAGPKMRVVSKDDFEGGLKIRKRT